MALSEMPGEFAIAAVEAHAQYPDSHCGRCVPSPCSGANLPFQGVQRRLKLHENPDFKKLVMGPFLIDLRGMGSILQISVSLTL